MNFYSLSGSESVEKENVVAVILAAGYGKRMKSETPKVAHLILGMPLIYWPLHALIYSGIKKIVVVLSPHQTQVVSLVETLKKESELFKSVQIEVAFQHDALGTAHAAAQALPHVINLADNKPATVLVSLGDMPAVTPKSYAAYLNNHLQNKNEVTVLGFEPRDGKTYGRILQDSTGAFAEIREFKDCSTAQQRTKLCNSGFMCTSVEAFKTLLPQIKNENAAQEYYLTDLPKLAFQNGSQVGLHTLKDPNELEGVNSQTQLADVARIVQKQIVAYWLDQGVQIFNPEQVYIEPWVTFESGVQIEPFVYLAGRQHFSKGTRVKAFSRFEK